MTSHTSIPIPKEIEDEVRAQLEPLFSGLDTGLRTYQVYFEFLAELSKRLDRATSITEILPEIDESKTLAPKAQTALAVLLYLAHIELLGTAYADMAILLLTAKGIDLHIEPDDEHRYTRHVASLRDLDSPSLTLQVKLDFLRSNRVTFLEKCIDRKLRNDIAHANFEIDENGKFFCFTKKGQKQEVDIKEKFKCYLFYIASIGKVMTYRMSRVAPPSK